ncbi:MAG TPA: phosphatase PAP2 family protein [Tetragenococcus sp.]|nr:phosphatase PAP2 family protein [Tetragenococcus sp.]
MQKKLYMQFAASCTLVVLAFLTYVVKFYPSWLYSFDTTITTRIRNLYPTWTSFFLWITKFGNTVSIVIITSAIVFLLFQGKKYVDAIWLTINVVCIGTIINPLLKLLIQRQRPTLTHLVIESSYSFPSGHAAASLILYGSLLLLTPLFIQSKTLKICLQLLLVFLILIIGISRIYLGVHFPTDIIAGYCVSTAWLLFSYPYFRKQRLIWIMQKKQL